VKEGQCSWRDVLFKEPKAMPASPKSSPNDLHSVLAFGEERAVKCWRWFVERYSKSGITTLEQIDSYDAMEA
jgi:hypothetical protein